MDDRDELIQSLREQLAGAVANTERLRALHRQFPIMSHSIDETGRLISVSDRWLRRMGYERAEVLGRRSTDFLTDESRRYAREKILPEFFRTGMCESIPYTMVTRSGAPLHVLLSATAERDTDGRIVRSLAVLVDVGEQRKAEDALRTSQERLSRAARLANIGHWDWDTVSGELLWTDGVFTMFGYRPGEVTPSFELFTGAVHEEDRDSMVAAVQNSLETKGPYEADFRFYDTEGNIHYGHATGQVALDSSARVVRLSGSMQDITHLRRLEERLFESQKMDSIGNLAGGVAHDFNNMLTGIMGYAGLLVAELQADDLKSHAEGILNAARQAAQLTQKLLTFSRREVKVIESVDLNAVIEATISLLARTVDPGIRISFSPCKEPVPLEADAAQMHQVVLNLGVNAAEAMPDGGELQLETDIVQPLANFVSLHDLKHHGAFCVIIVSDTGKGMTEGERQRAFDPFFTTKVDGDVRGTGLGLAVVYGVVRNHGGAIEIDSEVGSGTTVKVYLPRSEIAAPVAGHVETAESEYRPCGRILVVDDEVQICDLARTILERQGFSVATATNGSEALQLVREQDFDGVVLDMKMPVMGGRETLLALRQIRPRLPVLLSSGFGGEQAGQEMIELGAFALCTKPYEVDSFVQKVSAMVAKSGPEDSLTGGS